MEFIKESNYIHCHCSAYKGKGHNLSKGKCSGHSWAESYFKYEGQGQGSVCENCPSNRGHYCEVGEGQDDPLSVCWAAENAQEGRYPEHFHPLKKDPFLQEMEERIYYGEDESLFSLYCDEYIPTI